MQRSMTRIYVVLALLIATSASSTAQEGRPATSAEATTSGTGVSSATTTFTETFDGDPASPMPFKSANWNIAVHSRDLNTWDALEPMQADHDQNCNAPPASHQVSAYEETVYVCRNHMMTALKASGYGVIYLTPNRMIDFGREEGVIRFDLSTLRTSHRDWIDVWITPYQDHLQLPLETFNPDLNGEPRNAVQITMDEFNNKTFLAGHITRNFESEAVTSQNSWVGYEEVLTPSAKDRTTFEIRITKTHIKAGLPAYNLWWIDADIKSLGWTRGIVQFGHHSYNPTKDCSGCEPNTWHWDNISISPAVPFSMIHGSPRTVDASTTQTVTLEHPSGSSANLRFSGIGNNLEVSFDRGASWQKAQVQAQERSADEHFRMYWMPIPEGTTTVMFRGEKWWAAGWAVRDVSVWGSCGDANTGMAMQATTSAPQPETTATGSKKLFLPVVRDC